MKWAREYGIYVLWIFLYDIPGEDDARYVEMAQWLPLVSHLQAPSGLSFIQYNRFSPYHMRPAEYGLRLDPDRSYAFVYPWSAETITRFAYFFDDYSEPREQLGMLGRPIRREGLRRLYQAVAAWQVQWRGHMNAGADPAPPATLVMKSEGGRLRISDTRACRVAPQIVIDGLAARVYEACDRARSAEGLMRELAATGTHAGSWEDVEPVVRDLVDKKLLLALDGWFFSLALRGPLPPMPNIGNYPGGRLRKPAEARAAELTMYAEQLTGATLIPL
jgi:magnesium-protoporphyrin IX monomethyl ester (oxidative) cyclase